MMIVEGGHDFVKLPPPQSFPFVPGIPSATSERKPMTWPKRLNSTLQFVFTNRAALVSKRKALTIRNRDWRATTATANRSSHKTPFEFCAYGSDERF